MSGYIVGPTLAPSEPPWDIGWESDPQIDDGHLHAWESVLLEGNAGARRHMEEVIRCAWCHAPRCGYPTDPDPCMNRRHHAVAHVSLSGVRWPIGGNYGS